MAFRHRILDHPSDLSVEIEADSLVELVEASFAALSEQLGISRYDSDSQLGEMELQETIMVEGHEKPEILVEALNEWLFLVQTRNIRPSAYDILWREGLLTVEIKGTLAISRPELATEIKAVTYHTAEILPPELARGKWLARWIADL